MYNFSLLLFFRQCLGKNIFKRNNYRGRFGWSSSHTTLSQFLWKIINVYSTIILFPFFHIDSIQLPFTLEWKACALRRLPPKKGRPKHTHHELWRDKERTPKKKKEQQLSVPSTFVITGRNSCFLSLNVKKKDGTTETRRDP